MPYQNPSFSNTPQGQWGASNFPHQNQPQQPAAYCPQQLPPGKFNGELTY